VYLRHSTVRKNGKTHVYWRVVRSVRRNGKVVQETVAQLGELDAEGRAKAKALALVDIRVLDHVIVGDGITCLSEQGLL